MDTEQLQAFAFGVGAGVLLAGYVWVKAWLAQRALRAEIGRLKQHLQEHVELSHEGTTQRKEEVEKLRRENENLRVTLKSWQLKPDRRELRTLYLYDHAARQLMKSAPGFAGHWEHALEEAEQVVEQENRGVLAFVRRLVLPRARSSEPFRQKDGED